MNPHFLFITSTNLTTNPRCLKEIELALKLNFKVSVIKFNYNNWTNKIETAIEQRLKLVNFYAIRAKKKPFFPWVFSTTAERLYLLISKKIPLHGRALSFANSKRSWLIQQWLRKHKIQPDIIIAHNPPAFFSAKALSKKYNISYCIDVEDYHPGEFNVLHKSNLMLQLMQETLPGASYVSFASPLIEEYTLENIPSVKKSITVNNCFSMTEFIDPETNSSFTKLKLVWFSQNIDFGRGLEKIIDVLFMYKNQFEITLIGNLKKSFGEFLLPYSTFVKVIPPLPQIELHYLLREFDVGLAIEERDENFNREICLTNKIWSYFQAGLFIFASSTKAQEQFLNQHSEHGILFDIDDKNSVLDNIEIMYKKKIEIRNRNKERFYRAIDFCWEKEEMKLIRLWGKLIGS